MIEVILVIYFNSNLAFLTLLQKRLFQLAKNAEKYTILTLIFEICFFLWGDSPRPTYCRGATSPLSRSSPRGHLDCQVLRAPRYVNPALTMNQNILYLFSTGLYRIWLYQILAPAPANLDSGHFLEIQPSPALA